MKKSIIAIGILVLVILLEAFALVAKSKNAEPVVFALDRQEYAIPATAVKVKPFIFETNFVELADKALNDVQLVIENSFSRHLAQSITQATRKKEQEILREQERKRKLDEFRQAMATEPVEIRGVYLGNNACEVDGIVGICANGVYKLGEHCIACYDGLCAGAKCAPKKPKDVDQAAEDTEQQPDIVEAEPEVIEAEPVTETENTATAEDVVKALEPEAEIDLMSASLEDIIAQKEPKSAENVNTEATAGEDVSLPQPLPVAKQIVPQEPEVQKVPEEQPVKIDEPVKAIAPETAAKEPKNAEKTNKKQIAVVIDDIGLSIPFTNQIVGIGYPITVSFLPYGASNKEQVLKLKNAGLEVMLHVPMMPHKPANLAPVTLSPKMSKADIQEKLVTMLERFGGTGMKGINNHMGSAFTESKDAMAAVMEVLKERNMFFFDSMTTSKSVGRSVCRSYGVPYVARDVFLDNERNYNYIMEQFRAAERVANKKGYAVAIGHPYSQTLQALRDWLKTVAAHNIEIVPLSTLVKKLNQ